MAEPLLRSYYAKKTPYVALPDPGEKAHFVQYLMVGGYKMIILLDLIFIWNLP